MTSLRITGADYAQHGLEAWHKAAVMLLRQAGDRRVWCFHGDLGSGKTTCIQALCAALGVKEVVQSPTFGLVHTYLDGGGVPIYHFDLYRLTRPLELHEIGVEEYLESGSYCFIEWPSLVEALLPAHYVDLHCRPDEAGGREVEIALL